MSVLSDAYGTTVLRVVGCPKLQLLVLICETNRLKGCTGWDQMKMFTDGLSKDELSKDGLSKYGLSKDLHSSVCQY